MLVPVPIRVKRETRILLRVIPTGGPGVGMAFVWFAKQNLDATADRA